MAEAITFCGKEVDVGDRYEVIIPCLLWSDHDAHHETDVGRALRQWKTRVEETEELLRDFMDVVDHLSADGAINEQVEQTLARAKEKIKP